MGSLISMVFGVLVFCFIVVYNDIDINDCAQQVVAAAFELISDVKKL
jgi:hypothetical protein